MKKNKLLFITLLTAGVSMGMLLIGSAAAQEPNQQNRERESREVSTDHQFVGEVVSVDLTNKMLVVKDTDKSANTSFEVGAVATKTLGDIRIGDRVMVNYTQTGDRRTANTISRLTPPAKPKK